MKQLIHAFVVAVACVSLGVPAIAAEKGQKKAGGKDLKSMSQESQIKLAQSAAPAPISKDATIMVVGADGKLVEAKKGTNGFTCIPSVSMREEADPMCADQAVWQWVEALLNKKDKPDNTVPGVSYMARGGFHWEKDGKILMEEEPGAKMEKEPPHWMIMWPFSSEETKLPNKPNPSGAWVMFDGNPFAHLMIYQDPNKMKEKK
jgi:hypothetical protein